MAGLPENRQQNSPRKRKTLLPETPGTHLFLFFATIISIMFVYLFFWGSGKNSIGGMVLESLVFASALLAILLSHELGHYFAAKKHNIDTTLPFFIPAPIGIGTFGAFIQIKGKLKNRKQLMDVGASGPIAGFIVAVLLAVAGIHESEFVNVSGGSIQMGDSLLFKGITYLIKGPTPEGMDIAISPIAFAAWIGFLVTALNLIPASQLDGGHIIYSLFGKKHGIISRLVFLTLIIYGAWGDIGEIGYKGLPTAVILSGFALYLIFARERRKIRAIPLIILVFIHIFLLAAFEVSGDATIWLFWGGMLFLFGLDHPPVKEEISMGINNERVGKLDWRGRLTGILAILLFIATFMPQPIKIIE